MPTTLLKLILTFTLAASSTPSGTFAHGAAATQATPVVAAKSLDGRWTLFLDLPGDDVSLPVSFDTEADGTITGTVLLDLGKRQVSLTEGRLVGTKLTMRAQTPYGAMTLDATRSGDALQGTWSNLFAKGGLRARRSVALEAPPLAVFDAVWSALDKGFYDPRFGGVDWQDARARYRPRAAAARSEGELFTFITRMLKELRSSHLKLSAAYDEPSSFTSTTASTAEAKSAPPITWRRLTPEVGFIKIRHFDEGAAVVRLVDEAFAAVGDAGGLVIDLRRNGGGTLSVAMRLGDYIFPRMRPVGYFATRQGLAKRRILFIDTIDRKNLPVYSGYDVTEFKRELGKAGAVMIATGGRGARPYRGRVVMLIDGGCFSTTEGFLGAVKEVKAATLIGRSTPGGMLSAVGVPVTGGWMLEHTGS